MISVMNEEAEAHGGSQVPAPQSRVGTAALPVPVVTTGAEGKEKRKWRARAAGMSSWEQDTFE